MSEEQIQIYLGDAIDDAEELHVLARLRADLLACGASGLVLANFYAGSRRGQRQVDQMVVTPQRLTRIELKNLNPNYPLIAPLNGPWRQVMPDGSERPLDGNAFHQAKQATYAVSDEMRKLARLGEVPSEQQFYKCIDTVICMYPCVPVGSHIASADHVTVIGYDDLVARLVAPGPRPAWQEKDWGRLIRQLSLFPEERVRPEAADAQRLELEDYCRRFVHARTQSMRPFVQLSAQIPGGDRVPLDLTAYSRHRQAVTLIGPSGAGKTVAASQASLALAQHGNLVLWARCEEYRRKQLSLLLARAVAPYTTIDVRDLIDAAVAAGREAILVLDGLNDCVPEARALLLEQLASMRLRHRLTVVVTSTEAVTWAEEGPLVELTTVLPTAEQRDALLWAHGGSPEVVQAEGFDTPFDLSLLAECSGDLGPGATRSDLYAAFVRRQCPSVRTQAALRAVARRLDEQMRGSLPIRVVLAGLERASNPQLSLDVIDDAMDSPLLVVEQGRVRFAHDLIARFLAADELVHRARSGAELARLFDDPRHRDLVDLALNLETEASRRYELLCELNEVVNRAGSCRGS